MELTIESLKNIIFSKEEVIKNKDERAKRTYNLNRAIALGHLYRRKVIIKFRTLEGIVQKIEARIWVHGEDYVSLKGGSNIPVRAIEEIEF